MKTLEQFIIQAQQRYQYRDNGRGPEQFDCWGLVIQVFAEVRGIFLPDVLDGPIDGRAAYTDHLIQEYAHPVDLDALELFDIVFMTLDAQEGNPDHAAIYIGDGNILHIGHRIGVRIEPLQAYRRAGKVIGAVRYED